MAVQAYINFRGQCREAVEFYSEIFGSEKPRFMLFGDIPGDPGFPVDEEVKKLVLHTQLDIKGDTVMFSDTPPGMELIVGNNISLTVIMNDGDEVKAAFEKLSEGGQITMPLQKTFWSPCYGYLVDKFGIGWQLSQGNE